MCSALTLIFYMIIPITILAMCNERVSPCLSCCYYRNMKYGPFPSSNLHSITTFSLDSLCVSWLQKYVKQKSHHDHKVWLFIYTYWSQPTCLPLCSDAELILRDWKYWFDSVSYFVVEKGGSTPSWLLAPCSHIGLATQSVPQETHNYSRPFRLVQQPVQLWLHSLVIYFIPFPLLRGTPQHNDQARLYNNVCDDKHSGS